MSIETTLARAAARDTAANWKAHKLNCSRCRRFSGASNPHQVPCKVGMPLWMAADTAARELKHQRELDTQVPEGQEARF